MNCKGCQKPLDKTCDLCPRCKAAHACRLCREPNYPIHYGICAACSAYSRHRKVLFAGECHEPHPQAPERLRAYAQRAKMGVELFS